MSGAAPDPLDRIETWGKGLRDSQIGWGHKVLALVEVARAARVVNGNGVGEFDTRTEAALFPLRAALARLDSHAPPDPR